MNLSDRLKAERERLGYSQTEFAEMVGSSKHTQINWEKGVGAPNAVALSAWARYGLDVMYVVTGDRQVQQGALAVEEERAAYLVTKPDEKALIDNYRNSSVEGQKAMRATGAALAEPKTKKRPA